MTAVNVYCAHIGCLKEKSKRVCTLTPTWTWALTQPITRRGVQMKHKQTLFAQLEVTFTCRHLTLTLFFHCFVTFFIDTIAIIPTGSHPWDLRNFTWHYFNMLAARAGKSRTLRLMQTHMNSDVHIGTRDDAIHRYAPILLPWYHEHWFFYPLIGRLSSLLSLSLCHRILVPVNLYSRHNPKHSSKLPLTTAWNRPEI